MEYLRVELKVCEGCGGLWFRTDNAETVYGRCCAGKLAVHAKAGADRRCGRRAKHQASAMRGGAE